MLRRNPLAAMAMHRDGLPRHSLQEDHHKEQVQGSSPTHSSEAPLKVGAWAMTCSVLAHAVVEVPACEQSLSFQYTRDHFEIGEAHDSTFAPDIKLLNAMPLPEPGMSCAGGC